MSSAPPRSPLCWSRSFPLLLVAVALAVPNLARAFGCPGPVESEVVEQINLERARANLPPVEMDVRIVEAAQRHSDDMAANGFLSHTGSDGSGSWSRMLDAGYPAPAGEVAGAGTASASEIVDAWMASDSHRQILLWDELTHVGVGYASSSLSYRHFWTADFGWSPEEAWSPDAYCGGAQSSDPEPDPNPAPAPVYACSDGTDDDGDGLTDFPDDPGCASPEDESEQDPGLACDDGVDNDGDGFVDRADVGCRDASWTTESPACSDGIDNDGDRRIDFDGGDAGAARDRQCGSRPWQDTEGKAHKKRR